MSRSPFVALVASLCFAACGHAAPASVDPIERTALLPAIAKALREGYVFPDKVPAIMAGLRQRERAGAFAATDGEALAKALTDDLRRIGGDVHLGVDFIPDGIPAEPAVADKDRQAAREHFSAQANYGFDKLERLDDGIGYLHISAFLDANRSGPVIAAAMRFLATGKALIIDLRGNHGGNPGVVAQVASYLLPEGTHLNDIYMRGSNSTRQYWTFGVDPALRFSGPVYVLTDKDTVSGGEELAYDLKVQKRATLIGEVTRGGANPGGPVAIGSHFQIFVPGGRQSTRSPGPTGKALA